MEVDLAEHVVPRLQVLLDGIEPFGRDVEALLIGGDLQRVQDPLQIVEAVFGAGHQAVAQEIIEAVHVHLAGDELRDESRPIGVLQGGDDSRREIAIPLDEDPMDRRPLIEDNARSPLLVPIPENGLHDVRERPVPDIVKQRGAGGRQARLAIDRIPSPQMGEDAPHQMHHAERMREAAVLSPLIGEERQAQLLDPTQALELGGINQPDEHPIIRVGFVERDDVVHRIAIDALGHDLTLSREARGGPTARPPDAGAARARPSAPIPNVRRAAASDTRPPRSWRHYRL
ncbi:hypothetical protein HRbin08_01948 [bacterium HR08]|nr:hypothetical protein HRbin08_01948 [bacterium HR08]